MAEDAHSILSASGADGWSVCHGKPAMVIGRRTTSEFADEGTAAHDLTQTVLTSRIAGGDDTAEAHIGDRIKVETLDELTDKVIKRVYVVDAKMAEHVDDFVDRFMLLSRAKHAERFCEVRVHYHEYLGVPAHMAWGTSDAVAILWDQPELTWYDPATEEDRVFPAGDELIVKDLKYGAGVTVWADTLQLCLYGAGTYWLWAHIANFTRVRLVIGQPRKDHYDEIVCTPEEMLDRVRALRPAIPRVLEALELAEAARDEGLASLQVGQMLDSRGFLKTSEKGCRFCDAIAICPRQIAENAEAFSGKAATADEFENLDVDEVSDVREYGGNYLAAAFTRLGQIETWSKAVRAEIDRRVLNKGEKFDGVKVVAGKKGRRAWTAEGEVELFVKTRVPTPIATMLYKRELMSPAQMEKVLKSSPVTWAKLQPYIDQADGKPAVVPISDTRQAISHKSLREEFTDLDAEEQAAPARGVRAAPAQHPFRR